MLKNLFKAAVGVVVLPFDIAKDTITLGGELTNGESAIKKRAEQISENVDKAVSPQENSNNE